MPIWQWILIGASVVVVVAVVIVAATAGARRRKSRRLREHYGSEYERLVSQAGGKAAAEKELVARERKREKLNIVP